MRISDWSSECALPIFGEDRNAKSWYDCMKIEDLFDLPVADLAAPDCALFMWVTDPTLDQGIELLKHWGFTYVTVAFQWVKLNKSVGDRRDVNLDKDVFMSTGRSEEHTYELQSLLRISYPVFCY